MPHYTAHGLCFASELAFPTLPQCDRKAADVTIRRGHVTALMQAGERIAAGENFCITSDGTFVTHEGIGTALMRDGRELIIESERAADDALLSAFLLDVLGVLLYQRGRFVMHASALAFKDEVVAFIGESGRGKSTLALTLYERGHSIVSDDLISIDLKGEAPTVFPAAPEVNTWPTTLVALAQDPDQFDRVHPNTDKRFIPLRERFVSHPLPLKRVYVLEQGDKTRIDPLALRDAVFTLVRHSYRAELSEGTPAAIHLSQCAQLAQTIPLYRLTIHRTDNSIQTVARMVEADICRT